MIKIKHLLKKIFYTITIIILIFIYKDHEKNALNKINSFDFFILSTAINNKDKKTIKYKIKYFNNKISQILINDYKIDLIKNKEKYLILNKKNLNNKEIKNKINIFR
ncbi:MAG TPA: hypothetical protein ACYCDA_00445 [Candidatus Azoamicus sp.]